MPWRGCSWCPVRCRIRLLRQVFLKRFFELLVMFDKLDVSDDRKLDYDEFRIALTVLAGWGIEIDDPATEFASMDSNGGGKVMFGTCAALNTAQMCMPWPALCSSSPYPITSLA